MLTDESFEYEERLEAFDVGIEAIEKVMDSLYDVDPQNIETMLTMMKQTTVDF